MKKMTCGCGAWYQPTRLVGARVDVRVDINIFIYSLSPILHCTERGGEQ